MIPQDYSGIGVKNVTIKSRRFSTFSGTGRWFPGVLMIEGMAQTAGRDRGSCRWRARRSRARVYFLDHRQMQIRKPVMPGGHSSNIT